jgi:hypothetical protein
MSDTTFALILIGIITIGAALVILGKYVYEYCRAKRAEKKHIHNMCYPYRIVRLGDNSYALQHYVVPGKRASNAYWTTMKKYGWLPDAQKAMDDRMAALIADRARIIAKEERERMADEANSVSYVVDYMPEYNDIMEVIKTIDCPNIDKVTIDKVCSPEFMLRPDVVGKEGMI